MGYRAGPDVNPGLRMIKRSGRRGRDIVMENTRKETDGSSAMLRALDLIEIVARAGRALTLPELAVLSRLPKPTLHRLCQRLESEGYLMREPGGRHFTSGPRLFRIGLDVLRSSASAERHSILQELVNAIGETCNFTALVGNEILYLDRVEARWPLRLHLEPGSRVPMHCTASGKLILAAMTPARRRRSIEAMELSAFTPQTITDRALFEAELTAIAQQGYSIDREEFLLGLVAIAVPVKDSGGATVAAVACHGPSARYTLDMARSHLPLLIQAADRLAATLPQ
jgi:DNA-binding IclR family transcriptional regulator